MNVEQVPLAGGPWIEQSLPSSVPEALALLTPPLLFGNQKQIAAVEFLSAVEACREAFERCPHDKYGLKCYECRGLGRCKCSQCGNHHHCESCNGTGYEEEAEECACLAPFDSAVRIAAQVHTAGKRGQP